MIGRRNIESELPSIVEVMYDRSEPIDGSFQSPLVGQLRPRIPLSRRQFLQLSGVGSASFILAACAKRFNDTTIDGVASSSDKKSEDYRIRLGKVLSGKFGEDDKPEEIISEVVAREFSRSFGFSEVETPLTQRIVHLGEDDFQEKYKEERHKMDFWDDSHFSPAIIRNIAVTTSYDGETVFFNDAAPVWTSRDTATRHKLEAYFALGQYINVLAPHTSYLPEIHRPFPLFLDSSYPMIDARAGLQLYGYNVGLDGNSPIRIVFSGFHQGAQEVLARYVSQQIGLEIDGELLPVRNNNLLSLVQMVLDKFEITEKELYEQIKQNNPEAFFKYLVSKIGPISGGPEPRKYAIILWAQPDFYLSEVQSKIFELGKINEEQEMLIFGKISSDLKKLLSIRNSPNIPPFPLRSTPQTGI